MMATKLGERGSNGRTKRNWGGAMVELGSPRVKATSEERGVITKSTRSEIEEHQE